MRTVVALLAAAGFGVAARLLAGVADHVHDPAGPSALMAVVNVATPWLVVPVVGAWRLRRRRAVVGLAAACAVIEVAVYYGMPWATPATPVKAAWTVLGALGCAAVSLAARRVGSAVLTLAALATIEPVAVLLALTALGRRPWHGWSTAAAAEAAVGVVVLAGAVWSSTSRRAGSSAQTW